LSHSTGMTHQIAHFGEFAVKMVQWCVVFIFQPIRINSAMWSNIEHLIIQNMIFFYGYYSSFSSYKCLFLSTLVDFSYFNWLETITLQGIAILDFVYPSKWRKYAKNHPLIILAEAIFKWSCTNKFLRRRHFHTLNIIWDYQILHLDKN
jgi:hypothetical protein